MNFLEKITNFQKVNYKNYLPLFWGEIHIGFVKKENIDFINNFLNLKIIDNRIFWQAKSASQLQEEINLCCLAGKKENLILGWRDELLDVRQFGSASSEVLFKIERAAAALLGVTTFGIHLNIYCAEKMWLARRSPNKAVEPNKLDQAVAGGIAAGLSPQETLIKEALEEAGINFALAQKSHAVSICNYLQEDDLGVRCDYLYLYDLQVNEDFIPQNLDSEVSEFLLIDIKNAENYLVEFKNNSALVLVDFLLRHSYIANNHPQYLDLNFLRFRDLRQKFTL